jgi:hypothetical protein
MSQITLQEAVRLFSMPEKDILDLAAKTGIVFVPDGSGAPSLDRDELTKAITTGLSNQVRAAQQSSDEHKNRVLSLEKELAIVGKYVGRGKKSTLEISATIVGIAAAIASFSWGIYNLSETNRNLRAANLYKVQSDVVDDLFKSGDDPLTLKRLDARISIADEFYEDKSLTDDEYRRLLCKVCTMDTTGSVLRDTNKICSKHETLWQNKCESGN